MEERSDFLRRGTVLCAGRYTVHNFIAAGGFGCTYSGLHGSLGCKVAIKELFVRAYCNRGDDGSTVMVGTRGNEPAFERLKDKFINEARSISRLRHGGIVHVYDVFEENGTAYYVMDFIEGETLEDKVNREGAMGEGEAVDYIVKVARALEYIHSRGMLHLDVKPANVMVDGEGETYLIDFGVSKLYDRATGENNSTLQGLTPGYAPLEQAAADVTKFMPASDVYSLGATLYRLLTGVTPVSASLRASGDELPPLPAHVSERTRKAVEGAMELNKTRRTRTVREFVEQLGGEPHGDGRKAVATVPREAAKAKTAKTVVLNSRGAKAQMEVVVSKDGKLGSLKNIVVSMLAVIVYTVIGSQLCSGSILLYVIPESSLVYYVLSHAFYTLPLILFYTIGVVFLWRRIVKAIGLYRKDKNQPNNIYKWSVMALLAVLAYVIGVSYLLYLLGFNFNYILDSLPVIYLSANGCVFMWRCITGDICEAQGRISKYMGIIVGLLVYVIGVDLFFGLVSRAFYSVWSIFYFIVCPIGGVIVWKLVYKLAKR